MSKVGTCFQIIKNEEVIANSYYEGFSRAVTIFRYLKYVIDFYNDSQLYNEKDNLLLAIRLLENHRPGTINNFTARLKDDSYTIATKIFPDEDFTYLAKFDYNGKIGITPDDIKENEKKAEKIINIDLDDKKIKFNKLYFKWIKKEEFEEKYPHANTSNLDVFLYSLLCFNFFDIQDMLLFFKEHSEDIESNIYNKYFFIKNIDDTIFEVY